MNAGSGAPVKAGCTCVEEVSLRAPLGQLARSHWVLRWNKDTRTFTVTFYGTWLNDQPDRDVLVVGEKGQVMTKMEADILHMQELLAEVARTGELK